MLAKIKRMSYIVSLGGEAIDWTKLEDVRDWPISNNLKELQLVIITAI